MNTDQPHIIFVGEPGFPVGFGSIQRITLIAQGLISNGCRATVLSYKGVHGREQNFPPQGNANGVPYRYTSGTIHRTAGFFSRNWLKVSGKLKELNFLRQQKRKGELQACIVSTMKIHVLWLYRVWLKLINVPLILDYVELNSSISSRTGRWKRINDYLFDRFAVKLSDAVTPISEFLIGQVQTTAGNKPFHKLPILCDFEKFDPSGWQEDEIRFMYCGAASYLPLIDFVLEAFRFFDLSQTGKNVFLDFILGGTEQELNTVQHAVSNHKNSANIRVFPNVPHAQIPGYYAMASALLIPLRPTVQDAARFPHKLGEYLASGRPVITTSFGEIKHYDFLDEQTALVAADYDAGLFYEKMQFILDDPERARLIGARGREMGLKNFNYKTLAAGLKNFILERNSKDNRH
jgi:glycosyltransferase involved in cell wall biosynthesis